MPQMHNNNKSLIYLFTKSLIHLYSQNHLFAKSLIHKITYSFVFTKSLIHKITYSVAALIPSLDKYYNDDVDGDDVDDDDADNDENISKLDSRLVGVRNKTVYNGDWINPKFPFGRFK
jgi:hypothetical protein